MRIPKMQKNAGYRITVPALNGGTNLSDPPNLVGDNQLTDAKNMWWKDQALRTRPGAQTGADKCSPIGRREEYIYDDYHGEYVLESVRRFNYFNEDMIVDGKPSAVVISETEHHEVGGVGETTYTFNVSAYDAVGTRRHIGYISMGVPLSQEINQCLRHRDHWYAYGSKGWNGEDVFQYNIKDAEKDQYEFSQVDPYYPVIAVNGKGYERDDDKGFLPFSGTLYEGYNVLTDGFRVSFTTDGKAKFFPLPVSGQYAIYDKIMIKFTQHNGEVTTFHIPADKNFSDGDGQYISEFMEGSLASPVCANIDRKNGVLWFWTKSAGTPAYVAPDPSVSNNLEITAFCDGDYDFHIGDMRFHTWFGGDTTGLGGGTRIFMSGNKEKSNLVCWSDANNPLYFPENNYAYIGASNDPVTAFGKQSDMLVIFKEHELYYATYQSGGNFTAQDVIDGKIIDVAANMAKFPIVQINAYIGCDCPHTIQLCNNRLVWATTEGKVYTLTSATPYSERNVREISMAIEPLLKKESADALKNASSGDFDGHYVLQVGNRLYVLDYNSSGYQNSTSYTGRNAERHMPWYVWEISIPGVEWKRFFSHGGKALLFGEKDMGDTLYRTLFTLDGTFDSTVEHQDSVKVGEQPVYSMLQTKLFDFGSPDRRKTIRRLYMGVSDGTEGTVRLSYITDSGAMEDAYEWTQNGAGLVVTPGVSRSSRFGVKAECDGNFDISDMVIRYELGGEVK